VGGPIRTEIRPDFLIFYSRYDQILIAISQGSRHDDRPLGAAAEIAEVYARPSQGTPKLHAPLLIEASKILHERRLSSRTQVDLDSRNGHVRGCNP
jgi:hypothetical protein